MVQDDAPSAAEYLPGRHETQVLASEAPVAPEDLPAEQPVQDDAPSAAEYLPAEQSVQAVADVPAKYLPAEQPGQKDAPVPVKQLVHGDSKSATSENCPATQLVHPKATSLIMWVA